MKYKNHDISTIIPPLGITWVPKEAVWSTLVHLIGLGCCFPAKIELWKYSNFSMNFVGFLNVIQFWLEKKRTKLVCFSGHPRHPPGGDSNGVKEILAWNSSVKMVVDANWHKNWELVRNASGYFSKWDFECDLIIFQEKKVLKVIPHNALWNFLISIKLHFREWFLRFSYYCT